MASITPKQTQQYTHKARHAYNQILQKVDYFEKRTREELLSNNTKLFLEKIKNSGESRIGVTDLQNQYKLLRIAYPNLDLPILTIDQFAKHHAKLNDIVVNLFLSKCKQDYNQNNPNTFSPQDKRMEASVAKAKSLLAGELLNRGKRSLVSNYDPSKQEPENAVVKIRKPSYVDGNQALSSPQTNGIVVKEPQSKSIPANLNTESLSKTLEDLRFKLFRKIRSSCYSYGDLVNKYKDQDFGKFNTFMNNDQYKKIIDVLESHEDKKYAIEMLQKFSELHESVNKICRDHSDNFSQIDFNNLKVATYKLWNFCSEVMRPQQGRELNKISHQYRLDTMADGFSNFYTETFTGKDQRTIVKYNDKEYFTHDLFETKNLFFKHTNFLDIDKNFQPNDKLFSHSFARGNESEIRKAALKTNIISYSPMVYSGDNQLISEKPDAAALMVFGQNYYVVSDDTPPEALAKMKEVKEVHKEIASFTPKNFNVRPAEFLKYFANFEESVRKGTINFSDFKARIQEKYNCMLNNFGDRCVNLKVDLDQFKDKPEAEKLFYYRLYTGMHNLSSQIKYHIDSSNYDSSKWVPPEQSFEYFFNKHENDIANFVPKYKWQDPLKTKYQFDKHTEEINDKIKRANDRFENAVREAIAVGELYSKKEKEMIFNYPLQSAYSRKYNENELMVMKARNNAVINKLKEFKMTKDDLVNFLEMREKREFLSTKDPIHTVRQIIHGLIREYESSVSEYESNIDGFKRYCDKYNMKLPYQPIDKELFLVLDDPLREAGNQVYTYFNFEKSYMKSLCNRVLASDSNLEDKPALDEKSIEVLSNILDMTSALQLSNNHWARSVKYPKNFVPVSSMLEPNAISKFNESLEGIGYIKEEFEPPSVYDSAYSMWSYEAGYNEDESKLLGKVLSQNKSDNE